MFFACSFAGMYWRMAPSTSASSTLSHSAANAPKNTVLGMGLPRTALEMPSASRATMRGSSNVRVLFANTSPPGLSSRSHPSPSSVSSRYTT